MHHKPHWGQHRQASPVAVAGAIAVGKMLAKKFCTNLQFFLAVLVSDVFVQPLVPTSGHPRLQDVSML